MLRNYNVNEDIERWQKIRAFALETGDIELYSVAMDWIADLRVKQAS